MKNKEWISKLISVVIIIIIICIGVFFIKKHIEKPSKYFFNVFNNISLNTNVFENNLESIFKGKKDININTKVKMTNMDNTRLGKYNSVFSNNVITNIKLDTIDNYLVGYIKVNNNNKEYDITYVEEGPTKISKGTNERFKHIKDDGFNIKVFDRTVYPIIFNTIKNSVKSDIKKENIKSSNMKLDVNSKTYDTVVSYVDIDGVSFKNMVNKSINALNNDVSVVEYIKKVSGKKNTLDEINKIIKSINVDSNKTYTIKTYYSEKDKKALKISIDSDDNNLLIYTFDNSYYQLKVLNNIYTVTSGAEGVKFVYENNDRIYSLTYKGDINGSEGSLKIDDKNDKELYFIEYKYDITRNSMSESINLSIKIHPLYMSGNGVVELDSNILVSDIVKIDKEYTYNYLNDNRTDSSFKSVMYEYLDKISNYYRE